MDSYIYWIFSLKNFNKHLSCQRQDCDNYQQRQWRQRATVLLTLITEHEVTNFFFLCILLSETTHQPSFSAATFWRSYQINILDTEHWWWLQSMAGKGLWWSCTLLLCSCSLCATPGSLLHGNTTAKAALQWCSQAALPLLKGPVLAKAIGSQERKPHQAFHVWRYHF